MNKSPIFEIFEWGPNLPMEDDPLEDEFPFKDDDNSVATVPILPLLLPQHEPSITNDEHSTSTDNPGSTNNDDSDDDIVIIILN